MIFHLNGNDITIVPWQFDNDLSSNRNPRSLTGSYANSPGSLNDTRRYVQNVTGTVSSGSFVNLKGVYQNVFNEHRSESYTGDWEDMFEWSNENSDTTVNNNKFQCRIVHSSTDNYLKWQYRLTENSTIQEFKIDYASDTYSYDNFISLGVINNINGEIALNALDVPTYNPEYNGIHNVVLMQSSYIECDVVNIDDWGYGSLVGWDDVDKAGFPLPTNTLPSSIPYNRSDNTGSIGNGDYAHRLFILANWDMDFSFDPYNGYHALKFNDASPEEILPEPEDPNDDINKPSGPPGVYRDTSDPIGRPGLPTTSALSTGFIKAYKLTAGQAQQLSTYMLSDDFLDNVKKLMANPIDYIIGFHMIPADPYTVGRNIIIGGVDTEIGANMITNEYVNFSCGSLKVPEYWGSFIDYAPNCKAEIYVPFIGICPLDIDDIMNATLTLEYNINVLSGSCTAYLHCNTARTLKSTVYYWNGNMQSQIPITNTDYTNKVNGAIGAVGNLISAGMTGNPGAAVGAAANIADVALKKPTIQKSGTLAGDVGMLSEFRPFLIITRPVQALPKNYRSLKGNTSQIGGTVGSFSGFVECSDVKLNGIACTDAERDEILQLLEEGVFV